MSRLVSWLLVVLLLGAFGATAVRALRARAETGKGMPAYSVYSEDADGLGEAARVLSKLGWQPVAVTRPIQDTRHAGLLVLAEPPAKGWLAGSTSEISDADARGLVRWVERGNTLLVCSDRPNALYRELDIEITGTGRPGEDEGVTTVTPAAAGAYTEDVDRVAVPAGPGLKAAGALPLWSSGDQTGALLLRRGKGRVLAVADPAFLTRGGLLRRDSNGRTADNVVFLANVAGLAARNGRVYFDEYHHGFHSAGGFWGYLHYYNQHWLLPELLLAALVGIWAVAVRLGPAVPVPPAPRGDAVDYASALARIYQRAGVRRLLGQVLVRDFMSALTRSLHLRRGALPVEVLAAWKKRHPDQGAADAARQLPELLRGVAELRKGDVSDRRLLAWAQAFDRFQLEVLRARGEKLDRSRTGRVPAGPG